MVKEVALNIVAQIMFFIVNVFVVSWIGSLIIDKEGDRNKLLQQYEECNNERIKAKLERKIEIVNKRMALNIFVESWTIGLVKKIIRFLILLVTLNFPELKFQVGDGEYDNNGSYLVKGALYISIRVVPVRDVWWQPVSMLSMTGWCLCRIVDIVIGPFAAMCLLGLLLPSTLSSIASNIMQVIPMHGEIDFD